MEQSRSTILRIKVLHSIIFWVLSACVVYALYSGIAGRITRWTWVAVILGLVEGIVLAAFGWKCPLRIAAERLGAENGAVTDIFLPRWFAMRIFPICGTTFAIACAVIAWRLLAR